MITAAIIASTAIVSIAAFSRPKWIRDHLFETAAVRRGEYGRLISAGLLHANWGHLLVNMLSFYFFANNLELIYGPFHVAVVFGVGVVGGNLLALALHWNDPHYRALGASGGVCGIVFASVFLLPGGSIYILPLPVPIPSWVYAVFFVVYSVQGARTQRDNVGHDAHLGGALLGLAAATVFYPGLVVVNPLLFTVVVGGSLGAVIYLYHLSRSR